MLYVTKQKTAYEITLGDWSSDVCSSDLAAWGRRASSGRGGGVDRRKVRSVREFVGPRAPRMFSGAFRVG